MKGTKARTPTKGTIVRARNQHQNSVKQSTGSLSGVKHTSKTKLTNTAMGSRLDELQRLKLQIEKDILRSHTQHHHNPEYSLMDALNSVLENDDVSLEMQRRISRKSLSDVLREEEALLALERRHRQNLEEMAREERALTNQLIEQRELQEAQSIVRENSLLRLQLQVSDAEHHKSVENAERSRTLERLRTEAIMDSELEKSIFFGKEVARLTELVAEKNRQIESLTRRVTELDSKLHQQVNLAQKQLAQAHEQRSQHLSIKDSEFHRQFTRLERELVDAKVRTAEIQLKYSEANQQLSSIRTELAFSERKAARLAAELELLKQQATGAEERHAGELAKMLEHRNKMLNDSRVKSFSEGNHAIISHYDGVVAELKRSFEREIGLLRKDVLNLKLKLTDKEHEMEDLVSRYQPLLQAYQAASREQTQTLSSPKPGRADIRVLQVLTELYPPRVLS